MITTGRRGKAAILESMLPAPAFLAFDVRRDTTATVVYTHPDWAAANQEVLDASAWITAASSRSGRLGAPGRLQAERYGGRGIGHNGGGVRCGLRGSLQIKGVGCNSLRGRDAPADYSHGGMSLFECIQESLWSEIFSLALPFGAVRTLAVLGSDEQCWWVTERWGDEALADRYGSPPNLPRGLLVRQPALRPAHFERAALYRPADDAKGELRRDVERTRLCQEQLPRLLPMPAGAIPDDASLEERLEAGLVELATRYALQSAAAKAKRLVHGNITSSNICLDGRWIDFGSATALPRWGSACGYGPFWADQAIYADIFCQLLSHSQRFLRIEVSESERILAACMEAYGRTHDKWFVKRIASITGVPWTLFEDSDGMRRAGALAKILIRLARIGGEGYLSPHPDHHGEFGRFRLYDLMHAFACSEDPSQQWALAMRELGDAALASQLLATYLDLMGGCNSRAQEKGLRPQALRNLAMLATEKRKHVPPILFREHMVRRTEDLVLSYQGRALAEAVGRLHQEIRVATRLALDEADSLRTEVMASSGEIQVYDASAGDQNGIVDLASVSGVTSLAACMGSA